MRIIGYTEDIDLRTVVSKSLYLQGMSRHFELQHQEAVCFTNKARTRFRLILKIHETVFLCIPEIDEKSKLSVYLRISEELAKLAQLKDTRIKLELVTSVTRERIERRLRSSE
jgi:hypothetical protein